mmetsp:Transcript_1492/g.4025  ORF Transcript_1492/g.4025 Transcript_1492/m.4025 type:complete len:199 (+) Transcript_1492:325-921(+)
MRDEETESLWDHMTGRCLRGRLEGAELERFNVRIVSLDRLRAECPGARFLGDGVGLREYGKPNLTSPGAWFMRVFGRKAMRVMFRAKAGEDNAGVMPSHFLASFDGQVDARLPKLANGLGVLSGREARFYPMKAVKAAGGALKEELDGRTLEVAMEPGEPPRAQWEGGGEPFQFLSRWYGWSVSYPGTSIFEAEARAP